MDDQATVAELKARVQSFCEARDWDQFHGAKDLAIGVSTEAAELLEHFRFKSDAESAHLLTSPAHRRAIEHELCDVLFFVLRFAQRYGVDLDAALHEKMAETACKYPVEKARGSSKKYTEL